MKNTIRSIRKDVNGCKALFLCLFLVYRRKRIN
nr:MAG TPA: syndecan-2 protein [Caudoviricetes sp.]